MKESKIFSNQNLSEKVHYVYRVTIDGKYYIGKRSGLLNDLATGRYKTSSKLIWEKLKNGHHFSKIKILQVFSSPKEALEYEKKILTRLNAKRNPKFLNQCNGGDGDFTCKQHTEKTKEKISEKAKAQFDKNTEYGRKQREIQSEKWKEYFNPETEAGRIRREGISKREKERFNPETEQGRKRCKDMFNKRKEQIKEQLQKRQNASILGELMFDEAFIKQNFLIIDDKNNLRFLWSVYSKLTGYSESHIDKEKRKGKLSFLSGIKAIKLSEEDENSKIKEIEAIIKSRNEKIINLNRS